MAAGQGRRTEGGLWRRLSTSLVLQTTLAVACLLLLQEGGAFSVEPALPIVGTRAGGGARLVGGDTSSEEKSSLIGRKKELPLSAVLAHASDLDRGRMHKRKEEPKPATCSCTCETKPVEARKRVERASRSEQDSAWDRQTDRQTDRETNGETEGETGRQKRTARRHERAAGKEEKAKREQMKHDMEQHGGESHHDLPATCTCTCETHPVSGPPSHPSAPHEHPAGDAGGDLYAEDSMRDAPSIFGPGMGTQHGGQGGGHEGGQQDGQEEDSQTDVRYDGGWGHASRFPWKRLPDTMCYRTQCRSDSDCCYRYNLCDRSAKVCVDCWYGAACASESDCCAKYPHCLREEYPAPGGVPGETVVVGRCIEAK